MKIRAISIDDDPISGLAIKGVCRHFPSVEFVGAYTDPVKGIMMMEAKKPDLVFLDVEMPKINGLHILSSITHQPKVVIMSSNPGFRNEALGLKACFFIHKPVTIENFGEALASVEKEIRLQSL
ncbi:LytTR family DNA-binding domain-containing protein [Marinoscillum sp. MHG1-6]|uniref:LytR/AlgR family response regulator transcription factor n=1 Tax=Marinoscillum sp. MHG1-6 TaxID=2959627 RepID=UPI002157A48B|nr:response regulator [Marinoscillum sp. MHG1-6]